jgi:hypothetical protein
MRPPVDAVLPDRRTVSVVHFLLRSTMLLATQAGKAEWARYLEFSKMCAIYARIFAMYPDPAAALGTPNWATWFHEVIVDAVQAEHPLAADIEVITTLDRRLYARSFPAQGKIEISAVTREYLQMLNLVTWTAVSAIDSGSMPVQRVAEFNFVDLIVPQLLSAYRDVSVSRLPIPRVSSRSTVLRAGRTTRIQLTFLMVHEYAHALLHQAAPKSAAAEEEADRFAYDFLMSQPGEFESGEVWLALRWFFRTAALDRIIGEMLYGGVAVDWDQDVLMHRSSMIFEYAARRPPEPALNSLESIGTVLLMEAKGKLRDRGEPWLRSYVDDYEQQFGWDYAKTGDSIVKQAVSAAENQLIRALTRGRHADGE